MKRIVIATCLAAFVQGCAAFSSVISSLPDVIAAVTDGVQILDAIEAFINTYFAQHPDPAMQPKVAAALARARAALNTTLRLAQASKKLDDAQVNAAFDDFKAAYLDLLALVRPYGVIPATRMARLSASPGALVVPEPIAFHPLTKGQ